MPDPAVRDDRGDIFAGTAEYYARYRMDYPDQAYAEIERTFALDGRGTLLDLGTGPGLIALHLAHQFQRVVGLDVSAEMVEVARRLAEERAVTQASWHVLPAEELASIGDGPYRLVTMGSAFHWMDQPRVLDLTYDRTEPGGGVAILGMPGFMQIEDIPVGDRIAEVVAGVVQKHLGERRRAGSSFYAPPPKRWEEFLAESRYTEVESGMQTFTVDFDADSVVGLLYSTSFANRRLLGDRVEAFEADLRAALRELDPSGRYPRTFTADWVFARKR